MKVLTSNASQSVAIFVLGVVTASVGQYFAKKAKSVQQQNAPQLHLVQQTQGVSVSEQGMTDEQFSRINSFFGDEGFAKIQNAFIIVIGLGGVGSHAAHMLARYIIGEVTGKSIHAFF
jgi:hypothetical protein